jgi:hypothetical protein
MDLAMVSPAKWDSELVADLAKWDSELVADLAAKRA